MSMISVRKFHEMVTGKDVQQREAVRTIVNDWAIPVNKTGGKHRVTYLVDTSYLRAAKRAHKHGGGFVMPEMPPKVAAMAAKNRAKAEAQMTYDGPVRLHPTDPLDKRGDDGLTSIERAMVLEISRLSNHVAHLTGKLDVLVKIWT